MLAVHVLLSTLGEARTSGSSDAKEGDFNPKRRATPTVPGLALFLLSF